MLRFFLTGMLILLVGLSISYCSLFAASQEEKKVASKTITNRTVIELVTGRSEKLHRVTEKPYYDLEMMAISSLCWIPPEKLKRMEKLNPQNNPHGDQIIHVYVSKEGVEPIKSAKGTYEEGILILKEKLQSPIGRKVATKSEDAPELKPELFTAMLKREKGYNPECGDWEFIVVSGDSKRVLSRGKTDSCMDCHKDYKSTDFVTRKYMPKESEKAKTK